MDQDLCFLCLEKAKGGRIEIFTEEGMVLNAYHVIIKHFGIQVNDFNFQ